MTQTTLTALAPMLFSAAREVAMEPFNAVRSVNTNFDNKGVAFGDVVRVNVMPAGAAKDFTPAIINTAVQAITAQAIDVSIVRQRKYDMALTGEQIRSLENGGSYQDWTTQFFKQGARVLRNEMEIDCVNAIKQGASRSVGVSATTPFASNTDLIVDARRVLVDNGAPMADASMILGTAATSNLQKLAIYTQSNFAGDDSERRTGGFKPQYGFNIFESAGVGVHTRGTGASYVTGAAAVVGDTNIALITGTGTVVAGDVVTFAGDTNNYVVIAGVAAPGTITIGGAGLRQALASAVAMTIVANYTANLFFERNAVVGVVRPPLIPIAGGDSQQMITDDTGMTYLLCDMVQYGRRVWELHTCWGFRTVNGAFSGILRG